MLTSNTHSMAVSDYQFIISPTKQIIATSNKWQIVVTIKKYINFIFVIPATKQIASSGNPGIKKKIGSINLLLCVTKSCARSNSFLPINFRAIPSPNLSPTKNSMQEETMHEKLESKNPSKAPNNTIPSAIIPVSITGTKQKNTNKTNSNKTNTSGAYFELVIIFRIVSISVKPNARRIKNAPMLIKAKNRITKDSFSQLFIVHYMIAFAFC